MGETRIYPKLIEKSCLFKGIAPEKINLLLNRLSARVKRFECMEQVYSRGESCDELSVLIIGALAVQQYDACGNRTLFLKKEAGSLFAIPTLMSQKWCPVTDVFAMERSLMLSFKGESFDALKVDFPEETLIMQQNAMDYIMALNSRMMERLNILGMRTIRSKLTALLCMTAEKQNSSKIELTYSRQELADYLAVDRCALSKEMRKMSDEGLISFKGRCFDISMLDENKNQGSSIELKAI